MAAHTWKIDRDIGLARARHDGQEVARLEQELRRARESCYHVENPEVVGRCYKCGQEDF